MSDFLTRLAGRSGDRISILRPRQLRFDVQGSRLDMATAQWLRPRNLELTGLPRATGRAIFSSSSPLDHGGDGDGDETPYGHGDTDVWGELHRPAQPPRRGLDITAPLTPVSRNPSSSADGLSHDEVHDDDFRAEEVLADQEFAQGPVPEQSVSDDPLVRTSDTVEAPVRESGVVEGPVRESHSVEVPAHESGLMEALVRDSGEIEPFVRDSGEIEPFVRDSGEIEPRVHESRSDMPPVRESYSGAPTVGESQSDAPLVRGLPGGEPLIDEISAHEQSMDEVPVDEPHAVEAVTHESSANDAAEFSSGDSRLVPPPARHTLHESRVADETFDDHAGDTAPAVHSLQPPAAAITERDALPLPGDQALAVSDASNRLDVAYPFASSPEFVAGSFAATASSMDREQAVSPVTTARSAHSLVSPDAKPRDELGDAGTRQLERQPEPDRDVPEPEPGSHSAALEDSAAESASLSEPLSEPEIVTTRITPPGRLRDPAAPEPRAADSTEPAGYPAETPLQDEHIPDFSETHGVLPPARDGTNTDTTASPGPHRGDPVSIALTAHGDMPTSDHPIMGSDTVEQDLGSGRDTADIATVWTDTRNTLEPVSLISRPAGEPDPPPTALLPAGSRASSRAGRRSHRPPGLAPTSDHEYQSVGTSDPSAKGHEASPENDISVPRDQARPSARSEEPVPGPAVTPASSVPVATSSESPDLSTPRTILATRAADSSFRPSSPGSSPRRSNRIGSNQSVSKTSESRELESNTAESRAAGTKEAESKAPEPRAAESRAAESRAAESRAAESRAVESSAAGSRAVEAQAPGLQAPEPRASEPSVLEPRAGEPNVLEARGTEPNALEPRRAEPRVPEPRGADLMTPGSLTPVSIAQEAISAIPTFTAQPGDPGAITPTTRGDADREFSPATASLEPPQRLFRENPSSVEAQKNQPAVPPSTHEVHQEQRSVDQGSSRTLERQGPSRAERSRQIDSATIEHTPQPRSLDVSAETAIEPVLDTRPDIPSTPAPTLQVPRPRRRPLERKPSRDAPATTGIEPPSDVAPTRPADRSSAKGSFDAVGDTAVDAANNPVSSMPREPATLVPAPRSLPSHREAAEPRPQTAVPPSGSAQAPRRAGTTNTPRAGHPATIVPSPRQTARDRDRQPNPASTRTPVTPAPARSLDKLISEPASRARAAQRAKIRPTPAVQPIAPSSPGQTGRIEPGVMGNAIQPPGRTTRPATAATPRAATPDDVVRNAPIPPSRPLAKSGARVSRSTSSARPPVAFRSTDRTSTGSSGDLPQFALPAGATRVESPTGPQKAGPAASRSVIPPSATEPAPRVRNKTATDTNRPRRHASILYGPYAQAITGKPRVGSPVHGSGKRPPIARIDRRPASDPSGTPGRSPAVTRRREPARSGDQVTARPPDGISQPTLIMRSPAGVREQRPAPVAEQSHRSVTASRKQHPAPVAAQSHRSATATTSRISTKTDARSPRGDSAQSRREITASAEPPVIVPGTDSRSVTRAARNTGPSSITPRVDRKQMSVHMKSGSPNPGATVSDQQIAKSDSAIASSRQGTDKSTLAPRPLHAPRRPAAADAGRAPRSLQPPAKRRERPGNAAIRAGRQTTRNADSMPVLEVSIGEISVQAPAPPAPPAPSRGRALSFLSLSDYLRSKEETIL